MKQIHESEICCFLAGLFLDVLFFGGVFGAPAWLVICGIGAIVRGDNELRWPW